MPSALLPPPIERLSSEGRRETVSRMDTFDRTAGDFSTTCLLAAEAEKIRSMGASQLLTNACEVDRMRELVWSFRDLPQNWNEHCSPVPSSEAIAATSRVLQSIKFSVVVPERVQPSADGGIALTYVGKGLNRAMIEVLNEGEQYAVLYDTEGNAEVLDLDLQAPLPVLNRLAAHLKGERVAAVSS